MYCFYYTLEYWFFQNCSKSSAMSGSTVIWLMSRVRPTASSQSGLIVQLLPSLFDLGVFSYWQLSPSVMFVTPGICWTLIILWASTLSHHLACVADSLSFIRTLCKAWKSVLTFTRYPYTMSENC